MSGNTIIILTILGTFQLIQWIHVLYHLYEKDFYRRRDFLLRMAPGYFVISTLNVLWRLFTNFVTM